MKTKKDSLLETAPGLCREWDYEKNQLGPENYLPKSNKKVWWKCLQEHSWLTQICKRQDGHGCPYCSNHKVGYGNDLLTNYPELCREWDFEKNKLGPENYVLGSHKKAWWKCSKEHFWEAVIKSRVRGNGCPYCFGQKVGYGNDLLTNFPDLCKEWDYEKNELGPENYTSGSSKKAWWKCNQGHSWPAIINNRARLKKPSGCPYCLNKKVGYGNDLLTNHPDLCKEWDYEKNKLGPENYLPASGKRVWWKCSKGHSWKCPLYPRTKLGRPTSCPRCYEESSVSFVSKEWLDFIGVEQREVMIGRFRVDGFDPKTNTVYEFLGDYWHGNPKVFSLDKMNHAANKIFGELYDQTFRRFDKLQLLGFKIFYIWENDFAKNKCAGRFYKSMAVI